jgi:hypothetical protein
MLASEQLAEKAAVGALIRHGTMLSTSVNPTDGLRFDGGAVASPRAMFILRNRGGRPGRSWRWRKD